MRFYEFRDPKPNVYYGHLQTLKDLASICKDKQLLDEDKNNIQLNEFRNFMTVQVIDPNELDIGHKYYAIEFFASAAELTIFARYLDKPVTYLGFRLDDFIFKEGKNIYCIPRFDDSSIETKYGPYLKITTVFTEVDQLEAFMLLVRLKFSGYWNFKEHCLGNEDI
jgi:hypothetical protein